LTLLRPSGQHPRSILYNRFASVELSELTYERIARNEPLLELNVIG
jgi:hypothetical protein